MNIFQEFFANGKLPRLKADLISLAYAVALNVGGVTGDVAARNVNTMSRAELERFVTDHRAAVAAK